MRYGYLDRKILPDTQLIDDTSIQRDPFSRGPLVDMDLMTSIPNIFAAGNILRGAAMHDRCALEGKKAAKNILARLQSANFKANDGVLLRAEAPLRYVVPQKIAPAKIAPCSWPWRDSGYSFQAKSTIMKAVIGAWSGNTKIWEGRYRKMIARTSYSLPVEKFDWKNVSPDKEVFLRIKF